MEKYVGVDLGGTQVRVGLVEDGVIINRFAMPVSAQADEATVLQEVKEAIAQVFTSEVKAIGVGVPSLVDAPRGIVYEVQHIPNWQEVHLKAQLEAAFHVPVQVDNDVNCFALGEHSFGKGQQCAHLLGISIGTGIGAGLVLNGKRYAGRNGGAGEIGMMPYLDANYEQYCSGQFFKTTYQTSGQAVYEAALQGNATALHRLETFGSHLGNLMLAVLYAFDPEMIILGGSVSKAYNFFQKTMWEGIHTFTYQSAIKHLTLEVSELPDVAVLGAAALCTDF